jgi:glyoxylase-like metal-dependent hydrolase (beta-lactamase superfamily II)
MCAQASAKITMYRLFELGDCFLITFTSGAHSSRMLIDCGSFRNGAVSVSRLTTIVGKIQSALGGNALDVVVGTHQHNDHLSGFVHCQNEFNSMNVQQVWLSWLDDPADAKARQIGDDYNNLRLRLAGARDSLHKALKGRTAGRPVAARSLEVLNDMLGFFGAHAVGTPPELPADAVKFLKTLGQQDPLYLRPGRTLEMPGLPNGSVRIHVLGPPRIENVEKKDDPLFKKDPSAGESYDPALASTSLQAARFLDALKAGTNKASSEEEQYPFNQEYKRRRAGGRTPLSNIQRYYNRREDSWRNIDDDWLQQAGELALWIDDFTNNSSLVLAIELVESGKVLLFAADAQTGNWRSWDQVKWQNPAVKTDDLLARTVFYKVGHHASHNATRVQTFEKVNHPNLVAFIPVHKQDPNITKTTNPWKMPATNLFKRLKEKTKFRVLQMDNVNPPECNPNKASVKAAWTSAGLKPKVTEFSIEIQVKG